MKQRLKETVRSLRHRNFRIFFLGMLISFIGTWMQSLAQSWLVYRLSGSAWLLGLVGFAGQAPILLLSPVAGVMADRYSKLRIVILTQALSMAQALVLGVLTITGHETVTAVVGLAVALGVINAFDVPTRQSFMIELVGKEDLMNAIALNSSMINGARIIGPAIAGLVVAVFGEGPCFFLNAASYLVVLAGLLLLKPARSIRLVRGSTLTDLREGLAYAGRTRPVRALLALVATVSLFGLPYLVLLPIFADEILKAGPQGLGLLMGAAGVGAFLGALTIAARRGIGGLPNLIGVSVVGFAVLLILFSFSRSLLLSTILIVPAGFTLMLQLPATNTLLQAMVPDEMRGRVMSFYSMCLIGVAPFGSLIAGWVASRIGAPFTIAAGALLSLAAALMFLMKVPLLWAAEFEAKTSEESHESEITDSPF